MLGSRFPDTLRAAQQGESAAIETLYRDVAPLVLGYLRSNRAPEPEDTASDVFVSMMSRLSQFSGDERQFRSWLLTIAYRRMIDDFRRRGRRPEDPSPLEDLASGARSGDGEVDALHRLEAHGVLGALDALTPDQRAALMLRVLADLPVRDIAQVMGKPETAVKALLRRANASLQRRMEQA